MRRAVFFARRSHFLTSAIQSGDFEAMSDILVFQHLAAEPAGTLGALMRTRGHRVTTVDFERDPRARANLENIGALIVLGGPMNVEDRDTRAHLRTEIDAIGEAIERDLPILGICLGSQLLAHALGAQVRRNPVSEIGWYDVALTPEGRNDPVLSPLGESSSVFQWHGYTFDIPSGAVCLAGSATCANQAFRYGRNAYGLQFHLEMDQPLIESWLALPDYRDDLIAANIGKNAEAILAESKTRIESMQNAAQSVFGNFLDLIDSTSKRRGSQ
jgi:GMP synthase (glutamine-hydrolysing)